MFFEADKQLLVAGRLCRWLVYHYNIQIAKQCFVAAKGLPDNALYAVSRCCAPAVLL
jgi:hypothetical protein